jgi:hypothetical protein
MANKHTCECGGLRSMCAALGKHSISHYPKRDVPHITVVWAGRGELLGDRAERPDTRLWAMPTFDLDDGETDRPKQSRRYNRTGKYVGICSRTDPNAKQYVPKRKGTEALDHGSQNS